jgi:cardiolipin synthase
MLSKNIFINSCVIFILLIFSFIRPLWGLEAKKVDFVMDKGYLPEVRRLINSAVRSVQVMMFEASYYVEHPDSPSNQLINALRDASTRGVKVDVILDLQDGNERSTKRNLDAAKILKKAGVQVVFDSKDIVTHTKILIVDSKIVVCGSTNWTYSALTRNHEVSAIIYSEESAKQLQKYFNEVKAKGKNY